MSKKSYTQWISKSGFENKDRAPGVYTKYMRTREATIFENQILKGEGYSTNLVEKALDIFFETLQTALIEKRRVEIRRFGIFSLCHRPARKARNPGTGETVLVEQRTYVHFKMSKHLQTQLNQTEP